MARVNSLYQFGPFCLDADECLLLRDGRLVHLPGKAIRTLLVLLQNNGHVVDKDALMKEVWPDEDVEEGNLAQNIFMLRRALGETAEIPKYIETVPRRGYRFLGDLRDPSDASTQPPRLTAKEKQRPTKRYTESSDAYQAYLKARYSWSKHSREGLEQAIGYFQQAIDQDPNYSLAYAGMVDSYLRLVTNYLPPVEALPKTAAAIQRREIDDSFPEVQALLKMRYEWDRKAAEREIRRAIDLNSNYPAVHQWHSACEFIVRRFNEIISHTKPSPNDKPSLTEGKPLSQLQSISPTPDEQVQIFCIIAREQIDAGNYEAGSIVLQPWWTVGEWPKLEGLCPQSSADLLFTAGVVAGCVAGARHVPRGRKHAEELLNGSIALFEHFGSRTRSAEGRMHLASCYSKEGLFDLARATVSAALEELSDDDQELKSRALIRLAEVDSFAGRLHDAIERLNEAAEIVEHAGPLVTSRYHHTLANALNALAIAEGRNEGFDRTIEHCQTSLNELDAIGDHRYAAVSENNYGYLLFSLDRLDEAELHLSRARKRFIALGDVFRGAQVDDSLAQVHIAAKRFDLAEQSAKHAVEGLEMSGNEAALGEALTTHGMALCRLGHHREAKRVLDRAHQVAVRCEDIERAGLALFIMTDEMCEQLEDDELLELSTRLDQMLANSERAATRERLGKCLERIAAAQACYEKEREQRLFRGGAITYDEAIDSVAILPFANASNDPNMEYLSDGITESIMNSLSHLSQLKVMARSTVFRYKRVAVDAQQVGQTLGVRAVMMGRVQQLEEHLVISAELVDAKDGSLIWGDQYHRKASDIFSIQEELASEISEKLRLRLSHEQKKRVTKRFTKNTDAYEFYLRGRYSWSKRTDEELRKGVEYFRQAIAQDPNYSLAHAGLADCLLLLGLFGAEHPRLVMPQAKAAASKAIDLNETLGEAYASMAQIRFYYDWDWTGAEADFQEAMRLRPTYPTVYQWHGEYLETKGRMDEGLAELKRARDLDPLSLVINTNLGLTFYFARRYDLAIEQLERAIELEPTFFKAHLVLGLVYERKLMYQEAIAELEKARRINENSWTVGALGCAYASSGVRAEAEKLLKRLSELSLSRYVSAVTSAIICAGFKDQVDQTIEWLEKAYEERAGLLVWLNVWPIFDNLRSDGRFIDLLRRIGFPALPASDNRPPLDHTKVNRRRAIIQ